MKGSFDKIFFSKYFIDFQHCTLVHTVEFYEVLSRVIFEQIVRFFREIESQLAYRVKLALQNSIFDIIGATMRKSCPNMPKSRGFEDFKSVVKPGIHWTRTELFEYKVMHFQPPFTAF